jgi:YD repeat-containing protein
MTRIVVTVAVALALGPHHAAAQGALDGPACRNIPTSLTYVTMAQGFSTTLNQTCLFDRESFRGSCTNRYADSRGTSNLPATTVVATYPSIGTFIDEVRVVPPLFKALKATASGTGPGVRNSETTFTYDSQGRLLKEVTTGSTATTTYTEWDAAGRPTKMQDIGPGFNNTRAVTYDGAQRTRTTRVIPQGQSQAVITTVETFNADGNPVRQVASGGPSASTTTITINTSERVCR